MNLLYIGKYPPLEGGVGAAAFWRIKELRARGYNIDILTAKSKSEIYISEFIEETPGVYSLIGINNDAVWEKVKQAMKEIVEG